jgi:hypothetical protein
MSWLYQPLPSAQGGDAEVPSLPGWLPTYPERNPSRPGLSAAVLAGAFFFVGTVIFPVAGHGAAWEPKYPSAITRQTMRAADQQAVFAPRYLPIADLRWAPTYPNQIDRLKVQASAQRATFFDPAPIAAPVTTIEWLPGYPNQIWRNSVRAADQLALFAPRYLPIFDLRWQGSFPDRVLAAGRLPVYPAFAFDPYPIPTVEVVTYAAVGYYPDRLSRVVLPPLGGLAEPPPSVRALGHVAWLPAYPDAIYRPTLRTADQQAFVQPRYLPIFDLRWAPEYPNRVWAKARVVDYLAFVTGQTGSTIPYADLRWQGTFPSRIDRRYSQPHLWPAVVINIDPIANEPAPLLSWHPLFPDRIYRVVLPIGAIPFHDVRNLDPIPNDVVGGSQIITIGLEIGVTDYPVLGGWVPF